jgi:hypothetical protein
LLLADMQRRDHAGEDRERQFDAARGSCCHGRLADES